MRRWTRPVRLSVGLLLLSTLTAGCDRTTREAVEPLAVSRDGERSDHGEPRDTAANDAPVDRDAPQTDAQKDAVTGGTLAKGAGLWVVDAGGTPVGWLVQRGHPFQSQDGQIDILQDGVLVYSVSAKVFFGVAMQSGKVLVPRLGIADPQCTTPSVAGYYTQGEQRSGMSYAFAYAGKWWRVRAGQPTKMVQCAGVTKQGALPTCVLHSGTCRGFPVEVLPSAKLPLSFQPPLHLTFGLTP